MGLGELIVSHLGTLLILFTGFGQVLAHDIIQGIFTSSLQANKELVASSWAKELLRAFKKMKDPAFSI